MMFFFDFLFLKSIILITFANELTTSLLKRDRYFIFVHFALSGILENIVQQIMIGFVDDITFK